MLLVRIKSRIGPNLSRSVVRVNRRKYSVPAVNKNEESEGPQYPPILDLSPKAKMMRKREEQAKAIERCWTVEEKMIKINMPRYYGWKTTMLKEHCVPYNGLEQAQYLTRTHTVKEPGLPSYYDDLISPENLQATVDRLKESVEDGLVFEYTNRNRSAEPDQSSAKGLKIMDNIQSKAITRQVHRALMMHLAADNPFLLETEIDYDPRIEAFWFAGGIPTPALLKTFQEFWHLHPDIINTPVDRAFQYLGRPSFQLRHQLPLPEIISMSDSENPEFEVPVFKFEPRSTGLSLSRRHGTNIPGFWPGDPSEFGFVSYHNCGYLEQRPKSFNDTLDALKTQAVLGSWAWLLSQACNLGFSTFNDVTYPLTNQMIITNGKWWTFAVYQLNTTLVHSHHIDENPRRNICWMTQPMKLFEKIEDNKVHGLNNEVLENIVKFYSNEPRSRDGVELKPYLNPEIPYVADMHGPKRREWLEDRFKLMVSNRPRHRRIPEIFYWQEIYMRQNKTRPMDKKREPWEYGTNVWHRKLDDHCPRYVPKALRKNPHLKWEPTYYPSY